MLDNVLEQIAQLTHSTNRIQIETSVVATLQHDNRSRVRPDWGTWDPWHRCHFSYPTYSTR